MRIDSAFPSDYLKAADLEGKQVIHTIESVKIEEIGKTKTGARSSISRMRKRALF